MNKECVFASCDGEYKSISIYRHITSDKKCSICNHVISHTTWLMIAYKEKPMKEKLSATVTLNEEQVEHIITEYLGRRPIEIGKITIHVKGQYGNPVFDKITVETRV